MGLIDYIHEIGWVKLFLIISMIAFTNFIDTTAYSARLTGVRTQKLALSNSLYNMLTFGSRMTTALYIAPIGGIIDRAVKQQFDPCFILQLVLIGASIGTAMAILFMPTTVRFYVSIWNN